MSTRTRPDPAVPAVRCYTRALKNARYIQKAAPPSSLKTATLRASALAFRWRSCGRTACRSRGEALATLTHILLLCED